MSDQSQKGFTLLELLIAISLLAVILTFLTGAFSFTHKVWKLSEDMERRAPVAVARSFLAQSVSGAFSARKPGEAGQVHLVFTGEQNRLEFVTFLPERVLPAGFYIVTIYLEDKKLRMKLFPYHPTRSADTPGHYRTVADGVSGLRISYYGRPEKNVSTRWNEQWLRSDILPSLIKIDLSLDNGKKWPSLIMETKLK